MARLVFPGSPSNGDKHTDKGRTYQYNSAKNRWKVIGAQAVSANDARALETKQTTLENNLTALQATVANTGGAGTTTYSNSTLLPMTDIEAGQMAFDQDGNRLYITNGTGWYNIALVNEAPSITFASNAEFTMGLAGANTVDLTYTVVEPEGTPTTITVSNTGIANTSVANVQHFTSNNTIRLNNFYANTEVELNGIIRATVSDGINFGFTSAPFIISNIAELYVFNSHTFTTCGATGRNGPSLSQMRSTYASESWEQDTTLFDSPHAGYQMWTVPADGTYRIRVIGARGSTEQTGYGNGAVLEGEISLNVNDKLLMVVGQSGGSLDYSAGGGTFVTLGDDKSTATPLLIAGGGGGGYAGAGSNPNGRMYTSGGIGHNAGGTNGDAGTFLTPGSNAYDPGGGFNAGTGSSLQYDQVQANRVLSFRDGATGGGATSCGSGAGGFGGGGGTCPAGGGGYSGGGSGGNNKGGGGGGSYVDSNFTNLKTSNGSWMGSSTWNGYAITNLSTYGSGDGSVSITRVI